MAAKYLKQIHDIVKEAGKEEPSLAVKMVGYEARMKLGNRKWVSAVHNSSSRAITDVAKQALGDLQSSASIIKKNHGILTSNNVEQQKEGDPKVVG